MRRAHALLHWLVMLFVLGGSRAISVAADPRPNFIVILMDDLGARDLGCYGSDFYQTPHLDRMAREGLRFTQAYAAGPVCSPTRASLLTGQHPARLHLTDWLPGRGDRKDQKLRRPAIATTLPPQAITLAEALRRRGYATAHIGKWHLGGAGSLPQDHGFELNVAGDHRGSPASYFAPFGTGTNLMPGLPGAPAGEYLTDRLTAEAIRFIEAHQHQPFFCYLSHFAVHIPLAGKTNLVAKYRALARPGATQTNAVYASMIESMDESVGQLLTTLDRLNLSTNTLVIFTSDNGGLSTREGPNTPATSNAPWRAGKGYLYEGGLRVPLIARWPGVVSAQVEETTPVVSTDLYFTLLELAGAALPGQANDGVSLVPLLRRMRGLDRTTLAWHYPHYSNQGGRPGGAIRQGDFKLIESYESGYLELFNLRDDPGETNNLAGPLPQQANALAQKLADWRRAMGAQMTATNETYEIQPMAQRPDHSVALQAHDVTIHGRQVRYEPAAHKNTIGFWTKPEDWVSWDFALVAPGKFTVEVWQGCGKGSGGSEVDIEITGASPTQSLSFTVQDTGHFQNFVARALGQITLTNPGRHTLAVKPKSKPGAAVMDLRQITLKPSP